MLCSLMAGSLGYASRLSHRAVDELGGTLGAPELFDDGPASSCPRVQRLVSLVLAAKKVVVHTGAGISTACGVPDFRGPCGIWTLQAAGRPLPTASVEFSLARPSYTHQAILALHAAGKVSAIVSCNVDGLHLRSGLPRDCLFELHGNVFVEKCGRCGAEHVRDFEIPSVGFKKTGRRCACGSELADTALDWEDPLPEDALLGAEQHCRDACLSLTLGTSLRIQPANTLPSLTRKAGGRFAVVNLQPTPKDRGAAVVLRRRCDDVMREVLRAMSLRAPNFVRHDTLRVTHTCSGRGADGRLSLRLCVCSPHGDDCPVDWCAGLEVACAGAEFSVSGGAKRAREDDDAPLEPPVAPAAGGDADGYVRIPGRAPWRFVCRAPAGSDEAVLSIRATLAAACTEPPAVFAYVAAGGREAWGAGAEVRIKTVEVSYE